MVYDVTYSLVLFVLSLHDIERGVMGALKKPAHPVLYAFINFYKMYFVSQRP